VKYDARENPSHKDTKPQRKIIPDALRFASSREPTGPAPDQNGDMFQAPPRRDYVSPFEPAGTKENGPGF